MSKKNFMLEAMLPAIKPLLKPSFKALEKEIMNCYSNIELTAGEEIIIALIKRGETVNEHLYLTPIIIDAEGKVLTDERTKKFMEIQAIVPFFLENFKKIMNKNNDNGIEY